MRDRRTVIAFAVAIGGGALLWIGAAAIGGRTEAWDTSLYWTVAYPLAIILAGGLGWFVPENPWRWGLAVMLAQAAVLVISASEFGLLPLGLILFGILAVPAVVIAQVMARIRALRRR